MYMTLQSRERFSPLSHLQSRRRRVFELKDRCAELTSSWVELRFNVQPDTNRSVQRRSSQPIYWISGEKLNLTQQKRMHP